MAIRVKHGKPSTIITAAKRAGEARAAQRASEQAMAAATRLREKQMEIDYRTALKQQDMVIDLQMNERAKLWEIEKMSIRSRLDFQKEEKFRQRKEDDKQAKLDALEKSFERGIIGKDEYDKLALRLTTGIPISTTERAGFGIPPYWMRGKDAPEGTPEKALYKTKMTEQISGMRAGTLPWDLDPRYIKSKAAEESRKNRGIFLEPEDIDKFLEGLAPSESFTAAKTPSKTPAGVDIEEGIKGIRVISPAGVEGTIPVERLKEALAKGYIQVSEILPVTKEKPMFPETLAPRKATYGRFGGGL